jgi:transcription elongation factor Elf1
MPTSVSMLSSTCPGCGWPIISKPDTGDGLTTAKCKSCGLLLEVTARKVIVEKIEARVIDPS